MRRIAHFLSLFFARLNLSRARGNANNRIGGSMRAAAGALMLLLAAWAQVGHAQNSARFVRNQSDIAIIELSGNYDRKLADGSFNAEPRTVLAREFFRTHPDAYDMLVVFTGFPIETGELMAFHHAVSNRVQGIGRTQLDNTAQYGSNGKLQGFIDMAALSRYRTDILDKEFEQTLQVFAHEFLHQFGAYVKYRKPDGSISTELLGREGAHWSYLLDSDASVLYGSRWRDNGNGTFTSATVLDGYSALDLYLMGLKRKEEVPPFYIIDAPGVDPAQLPLLGATVTGTRRTITIDDIIAAEGPRVPDAASSQKDFRIAIVYAVRPGQEVSAAELTALTNIKRTLGTRFGALTDGAANINVFAEPPLDLTTGSPAGLPLPASPIASSVNLPQALAWLRQKQRPDGAWSDTAPTTVRDTAVTLSVLQHLDPGFSGVLPGAGWLAASAATNIDFVSRKLGVLSQVNRSPVAAQADELLAAQNEDGGWGAANGYASNALDTALALQTLQKRAEPVDTASARGVAFLLAQQNLDGGWGNVPGGVSRTTVTTQVLVALQPDTSAQAALDRAKPFLAGRQNTDGGFGDSPSSVHDTANVLASLMALNATTGIRLNDAMQYLSAQQRVDGSWLGSVYSTSLAVNVLARADAMNWAVTGFTAAPGRAADGQRVTFSITVKNTGNRATPAGKLRLYDGDPSGSGTAAAADADVPALVPGAFVTVSIVWNTLSKAGVHTLYAVVDPDRAQQELSIGDNVATLPFTVDAAQPQPDLLVAASDITATPSQPTAIPAPISVAALLTNAGTTEALSVKVVLWQGEGADRMKAGETIIANFPGRSTRPVTFDVVLQKSGATKFTVQIDPDSAVAEADETNNQASVTVSTGSSLDLDIQSTDVSLNGGVSRKGQDLSFTVKLRNRGTVDAANAEVRYSVSGPFGAVDILTNVVSVKAGEEIVQTVPWRAAQSGALTFTVKLDPANAINESDEANNTASLAFTVIENTGPSLAVTFRDITAEPDPALEGQPLVVSALIRNIGDQAAANVEVEFYAGDPQAGGEKIGATQTIATLAASAEQRLSATWSSVPDATAKVLHVVVDPANRIAGDTTREDNKAFISVSVKSLPDLAVAPGNLKLTPALPKPGDNATLEVRVDNLGQQQASNVLVRVFDGNPAAGGTQVGGDQIIAAVAGQGGATAAFNWPFPSAAGDRTLYVQVDPLQAVQEKNRANNATQLTVGVQGGDFTVSSRYFSPNGDGVLDTVDFTFRLQAAQTVSIQVVSAAGSVVQSYAGGELAGTSAGRWTWDGRNTAGSVAGDGEYRIRVLSAQQSLIGESIVIVDTNRSSLVDALGTAFASRSNLKCQVTQDTFEGQSVAITRDGDYGFFALQHYADANALPAGIYRVDGYGGDMRQIVPRPSTDGKIAWKRVLPSEDGAGIVAVQTDARSMNRDEIWLADAQGGNLRKLTLNGLAETAPRFHLLANSTDSSAVLALQEDYATGNLYKLVEIPLDGARQVRVLHSDTNSFEVLVAPDRRTVAVVRHSSNGVLVDVATGTTRELQAAGQKSDWLWAPDAGKIVAASPDKSALRVFDLQGQMLRLVAAPADDDIVSYAWSADSSEVLFGLSSKAGDFASFTCPQSPKCAAERVLRGVRVASGDERDVLRRPGTYFGLGEGGYALSFLSALVISESRQLVLESQALDYGGNRPVYRLWEVETGGLVRELPTGDTETLKYFYEAGRSVNNRFATTFYGEFGRSLNFEGDGGEQVAHCATGFGDIVFRSLQNLSANLSATRSGNVLKLSGTAADKNFSRFYIDYARADAPNIWLPVAPASSAPVVNGELAQWAPPGAGAYLLRLTVEDQAGNRRETVRRANWGTGAVLADVFRSPEYISPNADGIQDSTTIHYRVMEPVNIPFSVVNERDERVRSFTRSHAAIGVEVNVEWDGRNDAGAPVPDGVYRVKFLEFEFAVKVDNARPAPSEDVSQRIATLARVDLRLDDPAFDLDFESSSPTGNMAYTEPRFKPHVRLDWAVADPNFSKILVQQSPQTSSDWATLVETNRANTRRPYDPIYVPLDEVATNRYRVVASDLAGNTVTEELPLLAEQIVAANFKVGATWKSLYETTVDISGAENGLGLEIVETVRASITQVAIEYQIAASGAVGPGATWSERVIASRSAASNVLPKNRPLTTEGSFAVNWDLAELGNGRDFFFRVRVIDQQGRVFHSDAHRIGRTADLTIDPTATKMSGTDRIEVVASERLGQLVQRVDLLMSSLSDPAYLVEQVVWSRPGATTIAGLGQFGTVLTGQYRTCTPYKLRLRAVMAAGGDVYSPEHVVETCTFVESLVRPLVAACGVAPEGRLRVEMTPKLRLDGNVPLILLEFGRKRADGTDDVLYSKVNPTISSVYAHEFSIAALAEGEYRTGTGSFFTRVTDANNGKREESVRVIVDKTPLVARFTSPAANQKVCGRPETGTDGRVRNFIDIEGALSDQAGFDYVLQIGAGENPATWQDVPAAPQECLTQFNRNRPLGKPNVKDNAPGNDKPDSGPHCGGFTELAGKQLAGRVARVYDMHGTVSARLLARDWGGNQVCPQVTFTADAKVERDPATLSRAFFAPGRTDDSGKTVLTYRLAESAGVDAKVYRKSDVTIGATGYVTAIAQGAVPVRVVTQGLAAPAGEGTLAWDGRDEGGALVVDGDYVLVVSYQDGCGNTDQDAAFVIATDRTPPVVQIAQPVAGEVSGIVDVKGSVTDPKLEAYVLEFGVGADPQTWTLIKSGTQAIVDAMIASWSTLGLEASSYTLRLSATDKAGNLAETRVVVQVIAGGDILSYLEAVPQIISPNADGRVDTSTVRFGLLRQATVTVSVFSGANKIRTLTDAAALAAGASALTWDGRNDAGQLLADGQYLVELRAVAADNTTQTATIPVIVDTVKPVIVVTRPVNGFARGTDAITGSITDVALREYSVTLRRRDGTAAATTLATGTASFENQALGSLAGLAEGPYELSITALDAADNQQTLTVPFELDNTAPKVMLTAPLADAMLGTKASPFNVTGAIDERNLKGFKLNLGQGPTPAPQTELASGAALPAGAIHALNVAQLADGRYRLELIAEDSAGWIASSAVEFTVDNAMPTAAITAPAEDSYLKLNSEIKGTAADANFKQYKLEIAPGPKATASRFSEVSTSTTAVSDGALGRIGALPPDGVHTVRLTVIDKADNTSSALLQVNVDTVAPAVPLNLAARVENRQDVTLTWNAVVDTGLQGYFIYRDGARIGGEAPINATTYLDAGVSEGDHAYTVSAVDKAGNESARSQPVTARVSLSTPVAQILSPVRDARVGGLVDIKGTAHSPKDFKEFRVSVGAGATPSSWTLLRRSTVSAQGETLAQWNTAGLAEGSVYTLQVEAEDTFGAVGHDSATVTVDNVAPARPLNLQGTAAGSDVTLTWTANTEPDLDGYLMYRGERLANQTGPLVGDLKPYLIKGTTYLDKTVPDGVHDYTVIAVDLAGNQSLPSAPKRITLDTHAPKAVIAKPLDGASVDKSVYVLATTDDTDIAQVQFQYRLAPSGAWVNIGAAVTRVPYGVEWNLAALAYETEYDLRAVARDNANRTDPAPATIRVYRTRIDRPPFPAALAAQVTGGDVTLTWNAVTTPGIAGYHVYRLDERGNNVRLSDVALTATTFADSGLRDGLYQYTVSSIDTSDTESDPSAAVPARIFLPDVAQPYSPTHERVMTVRGTGQPGQLTTFVLRAPTGDVTLQQNADAQGRFVFADQPLINGSNPFTVVQRDSAGNTSKTFTSRVLVGDLPAKPTGLTGTAAGQQANLSWNANTEADLAGYFAFMNGDRQIEPVTFASAAADIENPDYPSTNLSDGDAGTGWFTYESTFPQWIEVGLAERKLLSGITLSWADDESMLVKAFRVQAWDGETWVDVGAVQNNNEYITSIPLAKPYLTDRVRIVLVAPGSSGAVELKDISANAFIVTPAPSASLGPLDGRFDFTVAAYTTVGLSSPESDKATLTVGDVTPPEPVTLQAALAARDVSLTWTASASADVAGYDVLEDGVSAGTTDAATRSLVLTGKANGTYRYRVIATDAAGNRSAPSNEVVVVVAVNVPGQPAALQVSTVLEGRALDLVWSAPATGAAPASYRVERALQSGGPYEVVASGAGTTHRDTGLTNGTRYFYRVFALNSEGDAGPASAEASGVPMPSVATPAPSILYPAISGATAVVTEATGVVSGYALPGSTVTVYVNGQASGSAQASMFSTSIQSGVGGAVAAFSPDGDWVFAQRYDDAALSRTIPTAEGDPVTTIKLYAQKRLSAVSWAAAARRVAFLYDSFDDQRGVWISKLAFVDTGDAELRLVPAIEAGSAYVALSPNGGALFVYGESGGQRGLWRIDAASSVATLLSASSSAMTHLRMSPSGNALAFVRNGAVELYDFAANTTRIVRAGGSEPSWSATGDMLLYAAPVAAKRQVFAVDMASGQERALTTAANSASSPALSPDAKHLAYRDGASAVRIVKLPGEEAVNDPVLSTVNDIDWLASGCVVSGNFGGISCASLPGQFRVADVFYTAGDNTVTATAREEAGIESAHSAPVTVRFSTADRPDLAIGVADIVALPSLPTLGEAVRVSVTVKNTGPRTSAPASLSLNVADPLNGSFALLDTRVPALASGQSTVLVADWTPSKAGTHRLSATIDRLNEVAEVSEANNTAVREVTVASNGAPQVEISTDAAIYAPASIVNVQTRVSNGGSAFTGVLEQQIEDLQGFVVTTLAAETLSNMQFGQTLTVSRNWSTGSTLPGEYRIRARLKSGGVVVGETVKTFLIEAPIDATVTLTTDRAEYGLTGTVHLLGRVTFPNASGIGNTGDALLRVFDAQGQVRFELLRAISLGSSADIVADWALSGQPAGDYEAKLEVRQAGRVLASATTAFKLVAATLSPPAVSLIQPVANAVFGAPASIDLSAGASSPNAGGSIVKVEFFADGIKIGEATAAPWTARWTGVAAGRYAVSARATDNRGVTADTAAVNITVNALPAVQIVAPADGARLNAPANVVISVAAQDTDGTIAKIEVFHGTLKLGECASTPCDVTWNNVPQGGYSITARATDNLGGTAQSAPVAFVVGAATLPPVVALTAPVQGTVLTAPGSTTLTADASSPNAGGSIAKVEFFQGTTKLGEALAAPYSFAWTDIAAGNYTLTAKATDNAGATADSAPVTIIVNAAPTVSIVAPTADAVFTLPADVIITAAASDSDGTIAKVEIFQGPTKVGECAASPCTVTWQATAAGNYSLTAKATDNRGATATSTAVAIHVDPELVPPTVSLTAPADQAMFQAPASITLTANASSPNTGGSIAKVEFFQGATKLGEATAAPYSFNWTAVGAGTYALKAKATDDRGVSRESAVVTVIVNAQPTVSITSPAANATFTAPAQITVTAAAADTDGMVSKIEIYQGTEKIGECAATPCSITWSNVAAGNYTLTAKAADDRGGAATSAAVPIAVGSLSGTLTLSPATVDVGQQVQFNAQVTSPAAEANVPLKVRVFNSATNATLSEWTTTATLVANVPYAWLFAFDTTAKTAGTYAVTLTATVGGADKTLAQTTLTLRSAAAVQLSAILNKEAKVLVLASCLKSNGNNDMPDPACVAQRKAYLDELFSDLAITHRVVTDVEEFRTQMRCGDWNVFWISGGRSTLKDRMVEELGQQVKAGKGLIVDGVHDNRDNGLDAILGVNYKGKQPANRTFTVVPADQPIIATTFATAGRGSKFEILSASAVVHARLDTANGDPAIVSTSYGAGRAFTFAFDLAGSMIADDDAEVMMMPLAQLAAPALLPTSSTQRVRVTVTNTGGAGTAEVRAVLPPGVTLAWAFPAPSSGTTWQLPLAAGATATIDLTLGMPPAEGTYTVAFESGDETETLTLNVGDISGGMHDTVNQALNALNLSGAALTARNKAVQYVTESKAAMATSAEQALYKLLDAAAEAAKIPAASAGIAPVKLARLAVAVGPAWCGQLAACVRPEPGVTMLSSYNVLAFGSAQFTNGSAEGSIGVAGSAQLGNYAVASQITGDMGRLYTGGSVNWGSGSVGKNGSGVIRAGGSLTITQSVGRRAAEGQTATEDWEGLKTNLIALSTRLGQTTGSAPISAAGGKFTLKGTHPSLNVFTMPGTLLAQARTLVFDVPLASTVMINVTGTSATFTNGQQFVMENGQKKAMTGHALAGRTLFNFPQATSVTGSSWGLQGTLLAPQANVNYSNGNIFGQVFANNLTTGNVGFQHCGSFKGQLPQ
jgi:choice-of-anchor A domain-containing protein